jgi:SAM-dependent methyltransferase
MQSDEATKRFYDAPAQATAEAWYPNEALLPTIREFPAHLPENPRILDLGCGTGHESMRMASEGATVLGLDYSPESIQIARQRCPQCTFELADFRGLDGRFGTFHGVWAAGSLIHIRPDELSPLLGRIADVLEAGGIMLAIVREGEGTRVLWPEVDGQKLKRVLYLHRAQDLALTTPKLAYLRDLQLPEEQTEQGWRAHLLARACTAKAQASS